MNSGTVFSLNFKHATLNYALATHPSDLRYRRDVLRSGFVVVGTAGQTATNPRAWPAFINSHAPLTTIPYLKALWPPVVLSFYQ